MRRVQTALVTGGAGFIGSHVVDLLINMHFKVRVIDNLSGGHEQNLMQHSSNANLSVEWSDIMKLQNNSKFFKDVDLVFHFAGIGDIVPSIEDPKKYIETNVGGTVNVLEAARVAGVSRFVYAASSSCYGLAKTPTNEEHEIAPEHPYALSKYLGEQSAFHWNRVYGLPVNSVRIFNAYGPRVRTTGAYGAVFGVFLKQKLAGKPLTVVGDGKQERDFLHVSDVAKAFLKAAETKKYNQIWNLGAGRPQSVNSLVKLIGGAAVYIPRRPGEPDCTWADISKIKRDLDWSPEVSFEEGVAEMIADIDRWHDAPLWTPESISEATKTWFHYLGKD